MAEPTSVPPSDPVRHVHVLGVCGTGMGTFAGLLRERGYHVTGSDTGAYPPMSTALAGWGVQVKEGYAPENLTPAPDLVVVGNVIRRDNPEAVAVRTRGLRHTSFPEALASLFLGDRRPIVVVGTHGKTSTTSLLAWLLADGGAAPGFLVGGIPRNFPRSFAVGEPPWFVIEGDEYDTAYFDKGPKFLHYRPFHAVLTSVEFDHADIYRDLAHVTRAFERFVALLPPEGSLTVCGHDPRALDVARGARCAVRTYGTEPGHDWRATEVTAHADGTRFSLRTPDGRTVGPFESPLTGQHNLLNTTAALAVALGGAGLGPAQVAASLPRFEGVRKRQEVKGTAAGVTVVDDFAHHPTAVRETVAALRQRYPAARLWAVYHPESNTARRRLFQDDYARAFDAADCAVVARAFVKNDRLRPEEKLDLPALVAALRARGREAWGDLDADAIVDLLVRETRPGDVVLAMSGRDFDGLHDKLLARLRAKEAAGGR
jgi:UDP-N-acetylmuramate: L-alanyl-gamma-D-glutamyl-meso-diaminopimelate ligase